MIARGARGTDQEFAAVLDYLTKNFLGEAARPLNINKATNIELESVAGLTRKEAAALIEWRQQAGVCKSLEDLKKAPGVDYKKSRRAKTSSSVSRPVPAPPPVKKDKVAAALGYRVSVKLPRQTPVHSLLLSCAGSRGRLQSSAAGREAGPAPRRAGAAGRAQAARIRHGPRLYVSDETGGNVIVDRSRSGTVVERIAVGKRPRGIRLSRDGKQLLIALSGSPIGGPGVDESKLPPPIAPPTASACVDLATQQARAQISRAVRIRNRSTSRPTARSSTSRTRTRRRCRCSTSRRATSPRASRSARSPRASPCGPTARSST